jgi:hypothetical protein
MPNDDPSSDIPLEQLLGSVLDAFDTRLDSFSECEVSDKMDFVLGGRPPLNQAELTIFIGERSAFLFRHPHSDEADPLPSHFQPIASMAKEDGTITLIPDPGHLTLEMIQRWKAHLLVCRHPILKARYADLLFDFQKSVEGVAPPVDTARKAIDAYLEASYLAGAREYLVTSWLGRAVGLSASIGDTPRLEESVRRSLDWAQTSVNPNLPGTWTFLYDAIYCSRRVDEATKLRVVSRLEAVLASTTDQGAEAFDHQFATFAATLLLKHYRRIANKAEEHRVIKAAGAATEYAAAQVTPLFAVGWLQPLVEMYRDAGLIGDAERVQIEMRRRGRNAGDEMKAVSYPVQVPKEAIQQHFDLLCAPQESTTRIRRWAVSNVTRVENAQKSLVESLRSTPLLARIGVQAMNAGQVVAKVGSIETDLDGRLKFHLRQSLQIRFPLFVAGWQKILEGRSDGLEALVNIFADSPAFDETGLELIQGGLIRFFQNDYLAATHILIPQIERALRTTLGLLGRPTNTPVRGEKGVMQERNMSEALGDPEMKKLLPNDMHQHLQMVFCSRLGLNLRNLVSHGVLPAGEFSLLTSLLSLQGLVLLSVIQNAEAEPPSQAQETVQSKEGTGINGAINEDK